MPGFYPGRRKGDLGLPGNMPNIDEILGGDPAPQGTPTLGTSSQQPPVGGDVRSMAADQYRDAILRRLGAGGNMQGAPGAAALAAPGMAAPDSLDQGADPLQSLLRNRTSRRVLRGQGQGIAGSLPQ